MGASSKQHGLTEASHLAPLATHLCPAWPHPMILLQQGNPMEHSGHMYMSPQPGAVHTPEPQPWSQPRVNHQQHNASNQRYSGKIATRWRKHGRCPNKRCPYAASHTAINSPRYAKYMKESACHLPEEPPAPRPNALEIKDPSPNSTPPGSRGGTPPLNGEMKVRAHALEIKDVPSSQVEQVAAKEQTQPSLETDRVESQPCVDSVPNTGAPSRGRSRFAGMFGKPEA